MCPQGRQQCWGQPQCWGKLLRENISKVRSTGTGPRCPVGRAQFPVGSGQSFVCWCGAAADLFTMLWAACEAADKHTGGENRSNNIEEMLWGRSAALSCSYRSHQRWARGQAPTPATPTWLCSMAWVPWGSSWSCQGISLSPCYLVLPNQQDGTMKVAVTVSEVAKVLVKALTVRLGVAHRGIGLCFLSPAQELVLLCGHVLV